MARALDNQEEQVYLGRDNEEEWSRLRRAIELTEGFALYLASAQDRITESQLILRLKQSFPQRKICTLDVAESTRPVASWLFDQTRNMPTNSVAVLLGVGGPGLEPDFWIRFNKLREAWRRASPSVHLWFIDSVTRQNIRRQAPDIYSIRSPDFLFSLPLVAETPVQATALAPEGPWARPADDLLAEADLFAEDTTRTGQLLYARALEYAAQQLRIEGKFDQAAQVIRKGLSVVDHAGVSGRRAGLIFQSANLESRLGDVDQARVHYLEAMELHRGERNNLGLANAVRSLGDLEGRLGEVDQARVHYLEAMELYRGERNNLGLANAMQGLGDLEQTSGNYSSAKPLYLEARGHYLNEKAMMGLAYTSSGLARVSHALGDGLDAENYLREAERAALDSNTPAAREYVELVRREVHPQPAPGETKSARKPESRRAKKPNRS